MGCVTNIFKSFIGGVVIYELIVEFMMILHVYGTELPDFVVAVLVTAVLSSEIA